MYRLGVNKTLIDSLNGTLSLLDSKLIKLELESSGGGLSAKLEFHLTHSAGKTLKLVCEDIIEFGFYYSDQYVFYNVEQFKFIDFEDFVYLSLDPDEDVVDVSNEDQDFFKMKKVSGFLVQ